MIDMPAQPKARIVLLEGLTAQVARNLALLTDVATRLDTTRQAIRDLLRRGMRDV